MTWISHFEIVATSSSLGRATNMDAKMSDRFVEILKYFSVLAVFLQVVGGADSPLYPYGPAEGDSRVDLGASVNPEVKFQTGINFYGQKVDSAYVVVDGLVSFAQGVGYLDVGDWRQGVPNLARDLPFVAPFHYQGYEPLDPDNTPYRGRIYYRILHRLDGFVPGLLDELGGYMEAAVVGVDEFVAKEALVVTWENVTQKSCGDNPTCPSNTFQLVLVANDDQTFAIFNYYKMEIPFSDHQLAGMNGGHRRGWTDVIPCDAACAKRNKPGRERMASLTTRSGSDVSGRYIMKIDGDVIVRGGCIPEGLKSGSVEVFPRSTSMFGGQMLSVSAHCQDPGTRIYCRFNGDDQFVTEGVMETRMKGRCPAPLLTTRGEVTVEISSDTESWMHSTYITIIFPGRLDRLLTMSTEETLKWYEKNPQGQLTVRWDSDTFNARSGATLDISLLGYREVGNTIEWQNLVTLGRGIDVASQIYSFDPAQYTCTQNCDRFEMAMLRLELNSQYIDEDTAYQSITTGPVTLGWYVHGAMTTALGAEWPEAKCRAWDAQDRQDQAWLARLTACPCTLTQALADWGRWQPDVGCSMYTGSQCAYHVGAKHCVRSVHPSADGAGNQCCYGADDLLRYAGDSWEGSTPDRSHDWGAAPYGVPGRVPSLSHWVDDVVSFYYCCLWTTPVKGTQCKTYMDRRPTPDCVHYTPPASAMVYGDPHITTFDGQHYTFGGSGDFWLLQSDVLHVQGKFRDTPDNVLLLNPDTLKPTVLTSVVMWTSSSDVITVSLAADQSVRRLDVSVNGQRRFFDAKGLTWQDFNRVSVLNNADTSIFNEDTSHSNFSVLFTSGAAVQIAERNRLLHLVVNLPRNTDKSTVKTEGLLGTWDDNADNDFTTRQGSIVQPSSSTRDIYTVFAMTWGITDEIQSQSRFHFPTNAVVGELPYFDSPTDVTYSDQTLPPTQNDVTRTCMGSDACARDYYMTADPFIAQATKKAEEAFLALRTSQEPVSSCGLLDIPMAEKSTTDYRVGSQVTVTGCRPNGGPLVGSGVRTYACQDLGYGPTWEPVPDEALCGDFSQGSYAAEKASDVGMIAGIAVACVVVVAIIIVVVIVVRRRSSDGDDESEPDRPVPTKRTRGPDSGNDIEAGETFLKRRPGDSEKEVRMSEVQRRLHRHEESV